MDFTMQPDTPEIAAFRKEVRTWLEENMREARHLRLSSSWSTIENPEEDAFRHAFAKKLSAKGWLFPTLPVEYGGGGLSKDHYYVLDVEIGRYGLEHRQVFYSKAELVAPLLLKHGTDEQKRELLPPLLRAEVSVWQVMTEPQGGSDIATCRTRAIRDGDCYVVNGQKVMVGHHTKPDYFCLFVNTNPEGKRHENLSWLYVPADLPGITLTPMRLMMGVKRAIYFDDVRVPVKYLIGGENNGWKASDALLELEHGGNGGLGESPMYEHLIAHCSTPDAHGQRLIDDPDVRDVLAEMKIDLDTERLLGQRNRWHYQESVPLGYRGSQFFYWYRIVNLRNAERLEKILGYDALVPLHPKHEIADFEYTVRLGSGLLHGGGTLHTDRVIIARRLNLGRAQAGPA